RRPLPSECSAVFRVAGAEASSVAGTLRVPSPLRDSEPPRHTECACYFQSPGRRRLRPGHPQRLRAPMNAAPPRGAPKIPQTDRGRGGREMRRRVFAVVTGLLVAGVVAAADKPEVFTGKVVTPPAAKGKSAAKTRGLELKADDGTSYTI